MARPSGTGGKTSATKARKASSVKGRTPTKRPVGRAVRLKGSTASGKELKEAREQQAATAEILRVISQSPVEVQPVFDAIVLAAGRLIGCDRSVLIRCDDAKFWQVALAGPRGLLKIVDGEKDPIDPDANFPSRAIVGKKTLHLPDWLLTDLPPYERRIHERYGINSALFLPLVREGTCIGVLALAGKRANIFDDHDIALAESFR